MARRRSAALRRDHILDAALKLADDAGLGALSMRRLGQALGVEAMSLYNHVANKDDIVDGLVDIVFSEIEVPEPGTRSGRQASLPSRPTTRTTQSTATPSASRCGNSDTRRRRRTQPSNQRCD